MKSFPVTCRRVKNGSVSYRNFPKSKFQGAIALLRKMLLTRLFLYCGRRVVVGVCSCKLRAAQIWRWSSSCAIYCRESKGRTILGDPGAVSREGRKGATKVFKHGRKSPWVPTLTGPFPNVQANAGSWLGTENALYYCAQSANSFSWVPFVSSYTTAIISPQLLGSFTKLS